MKQTFQPKKKQRSKVHGFRKRMQTKNGRRVLKSRRRKGRKVISIPPWMMKLGMGSVQKDYDRRNIESGMDPFQLPYTMDYNLFIDPQETKDLGVKDADIETAIFDSIKLSVEAVNGTANLVGMMGEVEKK